MFEIIDFNKNDDKPLVELKIRIDNEVIDCSTFRKAINYDNFHEYFEYENINELVDVEKWNDFYVLTFNCGDCDSLVILINLKMNQILCLGYSQFFPNIFKNENYIIALDLSDGYSSWYDKNLNEGCMSRFDLKFIEKNGMITSYNNDDDSSELKIYFNDIIDECIDLNENERILNDDNYIYIRDIKIDFLNHIVGWK